MEEKDDILLSRYLAGDLTATEKEALDGRLASEASLAAALARRKREDAFLNTEAKLPDLQAKMAELAGKHFAPPTAAAPAAAPSAPTVAEAAAPAKTRQLRPRRKLWYSVAGTAAAAAFALLLWNPFSNPNDYHGYTDYPELYLTEKSAQPTEFGNTGELAFNQGNYELAHEMLASYLKMAREDNTARLALGIAALETGRITEARTVFQTLADGPTSLADDGRFYLALTYLRDGELATMKATLAPMDEKNPDYGVRIRQLLQLEGE